MRKIAIVFATLVALAGLSIASAHPHDYVASALVAACDQPGSNLPGLGMVCIPTNHVLPDADGLVTFTIHDGTTDPTGGFLCLDADANGVCDDDINGAFCDSITVSADALALVPTILIFIDDAVFGNPLLSLCGTNLPGSFGTAGSVDHA